MNSVAEIWDGIESFIKGLRWLTSNPTQIFWLVAPILLLGFILIAGLGTAIYNSDWLFQSFIFNPPEGVWWGLFYWLAVVTMLIVTVMTAFVFFTLAFNVVAIPFYEHVSLQVERDALHQKITPLTLWQTMALVKEELKKVVFIIFCSTLLILIPGLNILSPLLSAFVMGWSVYDLPLARRGWTFRRRLRFVLSHFWSITGLGIWLIIPGLQFFVMPLAISGGTLLAVQHLRSDEKEYIRT